MKVAAIWARVSTQDQRELSLDGQVERVKAKLEGMGYVVPPERILAVDWTSLNLYACPQFQELRRWIRAREIQALGVLDRDRLAAQGLQRLNFLADCKDAGVEVIPYQGPPMLDGPEGQLVELALAIGKERSVERAQQGAKDGLRDRVKIKGLPPAPVNPYGYAWDATKTKLQPTKDWPNLYFICHEALAGATLMRIQKALYARGIPSPRGHPIWTLRTIWGVLTNPISGGRFYALRREAVVPKIRRGNTYGKSTERHLPLEEATFLPNVVVETPPLTWDEFVAIQERLKANRLRSARNAKREYRLRGFVVCDMHRRRYHGQTHGNSFRYACPEAYRVARQPCPHPSILGPALEEAVFAWAKRIIASPELIESELARRDGAVGETERNLCQYLQDLERRQRKNLDTETALVGIYSRALCSQEAFERQGKLIQAERVWLAEEISRTHAQLEALARRDKARLSLEMVRQRLGEVAKDDPRLLLEALGLEVHIRESGEVMVEASLPVDMPIVLTGPRGCIP